MAKVIQVFCYIHSQEEKIKSFRLNDCLPLTKVFLFFAVRHKRDRRYVNIFMCAFVWHSNRFIHTIGALKLRISRAILFWRDSTFALSLTSTGLCRCWISMSIFVVSFGSFKSQSSLCKSLLLDVRLRIASEHSHTYNHKSIYRIWFCKIVCIISRAHSSRRRIYALEWIRVVASVPWAVVHSWKFRTYAEQRTALHLSLCVFNVVVFPIFFVRILTIIIHDFSCVFFSLSFSLLVCERTRSVERTRRLSEKYRKREEKKQKEEKKTHIVHWWLVCSSDDDSSFQYQSFFRFCRVLNECTIFFAERKLFSTSYILRWKHFFIIKTQNLKWISIAKRKENR